jgi:tripeptidyl-peptidase I
MKASVVLASGLLAVANCAKLMSKAAFLPGSIYAKSTPAGSRTITLQASLKLQNLDQLEERLKAVASPDSPTYGQYIDADEAKQLFAPSEASRTAVLAWLRGAGITDIADHGWYVNFGTNVTTANDLLSSQFQFFLVDGTEKLRTLEYSVPEQLAEHIELISPTTFFGKTRTLVPIPSDPSESDPGSRRHHQANTLARKNIEGLVPGIKEPWSNKTCSKSITPKCMEEMYRYGNYVPDPVASGSRVGFGSFLNASACTKDLHSYQRSFELPITNISTFLINGGEDR